MRLLRIGFLLGLCAATACRDHVEVVVTTPASDAAPMGPTASGGAGGATAGAGLGGGTGDSGAGGVETAGGPGGQGGGATGGTAGAGGAADAGSDAGAPADVDASSESSDGGAPCVVDHDCPRPPTPCAVARCSHGRCTAANATAGTVIPTLPGDCHDLICDGLGGVSSRPLDENNVPVFENPCLAGTCNKAGVPGVEPLSRGASCRLGGGGKLCDGSGHCVQCLVQSDCVPGLHCQRDNSCGTTPCTDVACGGGCTPCDLGGKCLKNSDCSSFACDGVLHVCVADACADHQQDGNETDIDCGGADRCARCPTGATCGYYTDCATGFCDGLTHLCVTNGCTDHMRDGDETDVDCGGSVCTARCPLKKLCKATSDCEPGLQCGGSPQICA
jgi:hypothetical protein